MQVHDLGVYLKKNAAGEVVASILAGGGLGRTPIVGAVIKEDLPWQHLLTYCEAVLRVYNRYGRRDNMYKARIKILVKALVAGEVREAGRGRVAAPEGRPVDAHAGRNRPRRRSTSRRRSTRSCRTPMPRMKSI